MLLLAELSPSAVPWGWSRVARGAGALRGVPGLRLARALGSGHDGGFGLRPSASRQGLFAVFDGDAAADGFIDASELVARYRRRSRESCVFKLRATSARGSWGGAAIAVTAAARSGARVAALTRASIRPRRALDFWRHAPAAQAEVVAAPGCRLAVGLGEAPLLRQATFSVWDDTAAMDAYARSGAHRAAIAAARREDHFAESMFVRFALLRAEGRWHGRDHG